MYIVKVTSATPEDWYKPGERYFVTKKSVEGVQKGRRSTYYLTEKQYRKLHGRDYSFSYLINQHYAEVESEVDNDAGGCFFKKGSFVFIKPHEDHDDEQWLGYGKMGVIETDDDNYPWVSFEALNGKRICYNHAHLMLRSDWLKLGYQGRVEMWLLACFGEKIARDKQERGFRFTEESLELAQAVGITKKQVLDLVDYVCDRPVGELHQEVGGTMVTLAALCSAYNAGHPDVELNLYTEGEVELSRVWQNIAKIRRKHFSKPANVLSSLPGKTQTEDDYEDLNVL